MDQPLVTAFDRIPQFPRGHVRDLRVRWALEEIGQPYRTELFDAFTPRPAAYKARQPFGQVPAYREDGLDLFESGAILLYLGERHELLLPREPQARWHTIAWAFAALNSVEPFLAEIVNLTVFHEGESWTEEALKPARELAEQRLADLSAALGERDWVGEDFTIADILLVTVLRLLDHTDMLAAYPALAAYRRRGMERQAFQRALAAQCEDFTADTPQAAQGEPQ